MIKKIIFSWAILLPLFIVYACGSGEKTYQEGAILYKKHCENCHMEDGSGLEALYPPLAQSDMLKSMGPATACIIVNGLEGKILVNGIEYDNKMLPIEGLSAVEITNIINYINNAWGNQHPYIELKEVTTILEGCQ
jgi:mono/diheme cytochrome c family protein